MEPRLLPISDWRKCKVYSKATCQIEGLGSNEKYTQSENKVGFKNLDKQMYFPLVSTTVFCA